jgi:DNA-directed RNA polymerase specialized sigma24 family protein
MMLSWLAAPPTSMASEASGPRKHSEASGSDAFTELYHRHLPGIYRYHLARTGHVQEAEDLTAQTFLTALESISSYRGQGRFASWLFGIARHRRLLIRWSWFTSRLV